MTDQDPTMLATDSVPPGEEPPSEEEQLKYLASSGWPTK